MQTLSSLIAELQALQAEHGDLVIAAVDDYGFANGNKVAPRIAYLRPGSYEVFDEDEAEELDTKVLSVQIGCAY